MRLSMLFLTVFASSAVCVKFFSSWPCRWFKGLATRRMHTSHPRCYEVFGMPWQRPMLNHADYLLLLVSWLSSRGMRDRRAASSQGGGGVGVGWGEGSCFEVSRSCVPESSPTWNRLVPLHNIALVVFSTPT